MELLPDSSAPEPKPVDLPKSLPPYWLYPIVTEITRSLIPMEKDPFIEGL